MVLLEYHDRDYEGNTNVMQQECLITGVNTLADRTKEARMALGYSQEQLADRAGVSQGTIGNIESGFRKNPRELLAIANALGVRPEWLKDGKGEMSALPSGPIVGQAWPFEKISPERWAQLTERDKGEVEAAARKCIEDIERARGRKFVPPHSLLENRAGTG
jgi:transcriptional regulator with XRE-family HTH domain